MELHFETISALRARFDAGDLSPREITDLMLARIAQYDGAVKSYVTVMAAQARADADRATRELQDGAPRGPLHGVPVAVKDLCYTAGVPTMGGCEVLREFVPGFDGTVVRRLREAGAVILGKLNLTEGAMAGYNPTFDVPENPWRGGHWSGASSSGSGAATAAGLAYATLGSDTGGSIRHPAAACGTTGLKPTWGRVSRYGVLDLAPSLDHVGPLTRSSLDAGIVFDAIAGPDPDDPTTLPGPVEPAGVRPQLADDRPLAGVRIGFDPNYAAEDVAADFTTLVVQAVEVLAALGATIVDVAMPPRLREYMAAWQVLCSAEAAHAHRGYYPSRAADYGPWFREWLRRGAGYTATEYAAAHALRQACNGDMAMMMADIDMLACPSTPGEAYPVTPEISYGPIPASRDPWSSRFTVPADYAGLPALVLPCGLSGRGLPLSFQLIGHRLTEARLVRVGCAFERDTNWSELTPPGF
ncbi:MAG: amidase [Pseudomonadota bacterium]